MRPVLADAGTPAVALGPGSIEQAHTADEWISVADLEAGVEFFKTLLESLWPVLESERVRSRRMSALQMPVCAVSV